MGVDFKFSYYPAGGQQYEVKEVWSDFFVSLFDTDIELMKEGHLFASFVQQYREHISPTMLEWAESATERDVEELLASIPANPDEWEPSSMKWGPSLPFSPQEAKDWAEGWISFIEQADNEILAVVFPYTLDIRTGQSTLNKQWAIEDLQQLIAQAGCADLYKVQLTVECYGT